MCLKFTGQIAGNCSSGYLSKQYFPTLYGAHAGRLRRSDL